MQLKYKRIEPAQADVAITQTEESAEDFLIFLSSSSSFIIVVVVVVDLEFIIGLFFVINLGCALLTSRSAVYTCFLSQIQNYSFSKCWFENVFVPFEGCFRAHAPRTKTRLSLRR